MNSKKTCLACKERKRNEEMMQTPNKQWFCDTSCVASYANKRYQKQKKSINSKKQRIAKESVKTKAKWLAEAQSAFNKSIRIRDKNLGCVSCDKPSNWHGQWHCSHYFSRGHSSALRFNVFNCHKSCSVCNSYLSGNIEQYTPRLIKKIGDDKYHELVSMKSIVMSFDIEYARRVKKIFNKKARLYEKKFR